MSISNFLLQETNEWLESIWTRAEHHALKVAHSALSKDDAANIFSVFRREPDFGAAVTWRVVDNFSVHVKVVGLDGWRIDVSGSEDYSASASHTPSNIVIVTFFYTATAVADFEKMYAKRKDAALLLTGPNRSSLNENGGIQKTPSFIAKIATECAKVNISNNQLDAICVLEDRLNRIDSFIQLAQCTIETGPTLALLCRELRCRREWEASKHTLWLAFEVDGCIQVRPEQYVLIRDLMEATGTAHQLNMGLGKTRLILPCLLLFWTSEKKELLPRVYFLRQILDEGYSHLHRVLTASVLNRQLFRLPFQRDVDLTKARLVTIMDELQRACRIGAFVIQAPEHRQSMILKENELEFAILNCDTADEKEILRSMQMCLRSIDQLPWGDCFDEVDEILHHRKQLVYAAGNQMRFPDGDHRWEVIQASLRSFRTSSDIRAIMLNHATFDTTAPGYRFNNLQLLPGHSLELILSDLNQKVVFGILADPPLCLSWLNEIPELHHKIIKAVTDVTVSAEEVLSSQELRSSGQFADILMLRGLLGGGLLAHCLQKRHRVDFGVARSIIRPKRLAVPFTAADTPSLRSEFAQPDCALLFTTLCYYHDGLSKEEFLEAFNVLRGLGPVAQETIFGRWYDEISSSVDEKKSQSINQIAKLDTSNTEQVEILHTVFKDSILVIDFWLNSCVFPSDSWVFPGRFLASPWHLAHGAQWTVGFSGTNDLSLLLPMGMKERPSSMAELFGTNGKMLACLHQKARYQTLLLPSNKNDGSAETAAVLDLLVDESFDALIDVGALMAGLENHKVAEEILNRMRSRKGISAHRGVIYFSVKDRRWSVRNLAGHDFALEQSPIPPSEAITFFDESRCRGADIKLKMKAVAIITLCPRLTKSALMQAAGRLRALDYGQEIVLVATPNVHKLIRESRALGNEVGNEITEEENDKDISVSDILNYTIVSAIEKAAAGLSQLSQHGIHYASTIKEPENALQKDDVELSTLYGSAMSQSTIQDAVSARAASARKVIKKEESAVILSYVTNLVERYGADITVSETSLDEECERELEKEVEEEEEVEREVRQVRPRAEIDWNYAAALKKRDILSASVAGGVKFISLADFTRNNATPIKFVLWDTSNIFMTPNFAFTLEGSSGDLSHYLRPVDAMLVYSNAIGLDILLLSDRETEMISVLNFKERRDLRCGRHTESHPSLVRLAFLRTWADAPSLFKSVPMEHPAKTFQDRTRLHGPLAALQLFNGETMFADDKRKHAIYSLLPRSSAIEGAIKVSYLRGTTQKLEFSHLQKICREIEIQLHRSRLNSSFEGDY